jgi:hypothetical protein
MVKLNVLADLMRYFEGLKSGCPVKVSEKGGGFEVRSVVYPVCCTENVGKETSMTLARNLK